MCGTSSHTWSIRRVLVISGGRKPSVNMPLENKKKPKQQQHIDQLTHWSVIAGNTCGKEQREQGLITAGFVSFDGGRVAARLDVFAGRVQQHAEARALISCRLGSDQRTAWQPPSSDDNNGPRSDEMSAEWWTGNDELLGKGGTFRGGGISQSWAIK